MKHAPPVTNEAEVAVIGAGPAGAASALTLAQLGHDVVLIDKDQFPRDKPCGGGLTPPAISFLKKLGLDDVLRESQAIEGLQVFNDYSRCEFQYLPKRYGKPHNAQCIQRQRMDKALLDRAIASGVRFVQGRVESLTFNSGKAEGAELRQDGRSVQIRASHFIAADGATSSIRAQSGLEKDVYGIHAYAIRQFCTTENQLDPLFNFYIPVEYEGNGLVGYGWVFPVSERHANIGVGFRRGPGLDPPPPITKVLDSFVEKLRNGTAQQFGDIERIGKPSGSPVGIGFSPKLCQHENVIFIGDAARTTDPLLSEGITYALYGGEAAALSLHKSIKRGGQSPEIGQQLGRRFPRLGQDLSSVTRMIQTGLKRTGKVNSITDLFTTGNDPCLDSVKQFVLSSGDDPVAHNALVRQFAADQDSECRRALEELDRRALDALRTNFPFASEMLYREMQSHSGSLLGTALLLSTQACGASLTKNSLSAALAIELMALFPALAARVADQTNADRTKLNNILAILIADFAGSRSFDTMAPLGATASRALSQALHGACEGQMLDIEDLRNAERTPERYFEAVDARTANLFALSARLGAQITGVDDNTISQLDSYGRELGTAVQISNDVLDILTGDDVTGKPPGFDLRYGAYSLPVIYALEENSNIKELLAGDLRGERLEKAVEVIRNTGGVERAIEDCRRHADSAKQAIEGLRSVQPQPLVALADLAPDRLKGR